MKYELIISLALNYNYMKIRNFILSINKSNYKGDIIFFTNDVSVELKALLLLHNVQLIQLTNVYPFYPQNDSNYPISKNIILKYLPYYQGKSFVTYRYFIFKLFIKHYGIKYDSILFTDVRDVLFQLNPFQWNIDKGIYLVEEHPKRKIGSDKSNIMYVKIYKLKNKILYNSTIINGGIMYGSFPEIYYFLSDLLNYICSVNCNANDQGGINSFIRSKNYFSYPVYILNASHTPVKTLALWLFDSPKCCLPKNNYILNKDLSIPLIIHQYDRAIKATITKNSIFKLYQSYINYYTK